MSRPCFWCHALCAFFLSAAVAPAHAADDAGAGANGTSFSFAVLADTPFSLHEESDVASVLSAIGSRGARFIVHLGDLRGPGEPCSDELVEIRRTLLDAAPRPLILLPGGADWVACDPDAIAGSEARARLSRLRDTLFSGAQSLGTDPIALARESGVRRFQDFAENVRWESGGVLFVAINLPAPNNDFRVAAGRNGEFEDRTVANHAWLERAFSYAQTHRLAGVVVFCQADPKMDRSVHVLEGRGVRRDGFFEFKSILRELTAHFHGEVLLIHGADGEPAQGGRVEDGATRQLKNFMEARAFASPNTQQWVEVDVNLRRPGLFKVSAQALVDTAGQTSRAAP